MPQQQTAGTARSTSPAKRGRPASAGAGRGRARSPRRAVASSTASNAEPVVKVTIVEEEQPAASPARKSPARPGRPRKSPASTAPAVSTDKPEPSAKSEGDKSSHEAAAEPSQRATRRSSRAVADGAAPAEQHDTASAASDRRQPVTSHHATGGDRWSNWGETMLLAVLTAMVASLAVYIAVRDVPPSSGGQATPRADVERPIEARRRAATFEPALERLRGDLTSSGAFSPLAVNQVLAAFDHRTTKPLTLLLVGNVREVWPGFVKNVSSFWTDAYEQPKDSAPVKLTAHAANAAAMRAAIGERLHRQPRSLFSLRTEQIAKFDHDFFTEAWDDLNAACDSAPTQEAAFVLGTDNKELRRQVLQAADDETAGVAKSHLQSAGWPPRIIHRIRHVIVAQ